MVDFPLPPTSDPIDRTRDYPVSDIYVGNTSGLGDFAGSINEVLTSVGSVAFNGLGIIAEWRRATDEIFGRSDNGQTVTSDVAFEQARDGVVSVGAQFDLDKLAFYAGLGMMGIAAILLIKDA